jgi:hypothetical protein
MPRYNYDLYVNDNQVAGGTSLRRLSRRLRDEYEGVEGLSVSTIRRFMRDGIFEEEKGGIDFRIEQVGSTGRPSVDRALRNFDQILDDGKRTLRLQRNFFITPLNVSNVITSIAEYIRDNYDLEFIQNNYFRVNLVGTAVEGRTSAVIGTPFDSYNNILTTLYESVQDVLERYSGEDIDMRFIEITTQEVPDPQDVIVFGLQRSNVITDVLCTNYCRCERLNNIFECDCKEKAELVSFLSEYRVLSPKTSKNCLATAVYMTKHNREDGVHNVKEFVKNHLKDKGIDLTPRGILPLLAKSMKCDIRATFLTHKVIRRTYEAFPDEPERVRPTLQILIKGGHAYGLVPKTPEDITDDLSEEVLLEVPEYKGGRLGSKPNRVCTWDLETTDKENKEFKGETLKTDTEAYAVGFSDPLLRQKYWSCFKFAKNSNVLKSFLDCLRSLVKSGAAFYAHNGGRFDTFLLLKEILTTKGWFVENYLESNGRIINLKVRYTSGKKTKVFFFRDSFNFIPTSLDKACGVFETITKKLKDDVDHDLINIDNGYTHSGFKDFPGNKAIREYVSQYLKNDCVCLLEILNKFDSIIKQKYNFGIVDVYTNASIARRVFLSRHYKPEKFPLYTIGREIDSIIRAGYFGGRNECFHSLGHKKGKFWYFDFTSLYPYVQGKYDYPYGRMIRQKLRGSYLPKRIFGFVRVKVRNKFFDKDPLHAYYDEKSCKLLFPHFKNWRELIISTEEIRYSIENDLGYEYEFLEAFHYDSYNTIFKSVIDELYDMKIKAQDAGNEALRSIAKIIINSCYGFFGINFLRRDQTVIVRETASKSKTKEENQECRYWGLFYDRKLKNRVQIGDYDIYQTVDDINASAANVGIASMITSYARLELYKLIKAIKEAGGEVYYADTDSVICNIDVYTLPAFKSFVGEGGKNLGELTNETGEPNGYYTELITLAPKMYALRNPKLKKKPIILKVKGVTSKRRYNSRVVDDDSKEIRYEGIAKEGRYKICFEDYVMMAKGYDIVCDNFSFLSGSGNLLIKGNGLEKQRNKKALRGIIDKYSKAEIVDGRIIPFQL